MSIPFSESSYYHFSKDQKLIDLIQDFCSMQGISIVVSSNITDVVNGRFNKMSPTHFWDYITQAYGLTWFYDGKILYAYKSSELQTKVFKIDAAGIIILSDIIRHLGFSSSDFSFRSVPEAHILIVTAPPKYLETIEDLSRKFVTEKISDTTVVKSFPLKYAWAYDMDFTYKDGSLSVPGVATLLQNIVTGQNSDGTVSGMSVDLGKNEPKKVPKMQALVVQTKSNSSDKSSDDKSDSSSKEGNVSATPTLPGFITCDQRLNAIIIRDRYENMSFYEDIIKQLDVPCEVIKIDVAILNINRNAGFDLGLGKIDFSKPGKRALSITPGFTAAAAGLEDSSAGVEGGTAATMLKGILKGYNIATYVKAIEDSGNGQVIAKPSILTLDNVGAVISSSTTAYTKVAGKESEGLYSVTAGLNLQVVPHIIPGDVNKDGKHKMKMFVNVSDGNFAEKAQAGTDSGTTSSSVNTQAVLYEGQSLLIGGCFTERHSKTEKGIPFVMNLPLIGHIFKTTANSTSLEERIYLISPTIINIDADEHEFDKFMNNKPLEGKPILVPESFMHNKPPPKKRKIRVHKPKMVKRKLMRRIAN
jgi:type III secretion protein C